MCQTINEKNNRGESPLLYALLSESTSLAAVKLLLNNGAEVDNDILMAARRTNNEEFIDAINVRIGEMLQKKAEEKIVAKKKKK